MTQLRHRFIEDLQLLGKAERTQQAYVRAVRQLADHVNTPPDQLSEEQIRQYFLSVTNVKHWSPSTITQALCAIKTFVTVTLQREWRILDLIRPQKAQTLPDGLSVEEGQRLLQAVRLPYDRSCLTTISSCGLRLSEGTRLQVTDLDRARMLVHVRGGKGNKDRDVPLPQRPLELLRQ
jgi:integrase/recombinase XerD